MSNSNAPKSSASGQPLAEGGRKDKEWVVIVPTYNERENLARLVAELLADTSARILVVDDNSPDGTGALADELAAQTPNNRVRVLHRAAKEGLGRAYLAAFAHLLLQDDDDNDRAEYIAHMDADGTHRVADLAAIYEACVRAGADVAAATRYSSGGGHDGSWAVHRLWLSRIANAYARILLRVPLHDLTAGMRVYRATFLRSLPLKQIRVRGYVLHVVLATLAARADARVIEVPVTYRGRAGGQSKMNPAIAIEGFVEVLRLALTG